jgi:hypothetical protein
MSIDVRRPPSPPPAPRPIPRGTYLGVAHFILILIGAIELAVGLLLFGVFTAVTGPLWTDALLDARGLRATAEVLANEASSVHDRRGRLRQLRVRYPDRGGLEHEGHAIAPHALSGALPGSRAEVEYDPDRPDRFRLAGGHASLFGPVGLVAPGASLSLGLVLLVLGVALRQRRRALYRDGLVAEGRVSAVRKTAVRVNGRNLFEVRFAFDASTGPREGKSLLREAPEPQSSVWVIYDPSRPDRTLLA